MRLIKFKRGHLREASDFRYQISGKRGHIVSDEVIKWILYLAIVVAVGFAVRAIIIKAGS
ncbi:MAG: hypothetical protein V1889_00580 [archaeon]